MAPLFGPYMSYLTSCLPLLALAAVFLLFFHRASRHRPLPGIPYNKRAARRFLGDLPDVRSARFRRAWLWNQPRQHGGVISQVFLGPALLRKPLVLLTDYREAVDVCSRRQKEFDRGDSIKNIVGLVAPNLHFTMQSSDPHFKSNKELIRDLMTPKFLQQVSAPRIYDRASALVDLWALKMHKAHGRPFKASADLHLSALDTICAVAFGMEDEKTALGQQLSHIQPFNPGVSRDDDEPVDFPSRPLNPELQALLEMPEMLAIAQKSPVPAVAQRLALLWPRHALAWWHRRALVRRQTLRSFEKLTQAGEGEAETCKQSALDHLLLRELNLARKMNRRPDLYSPVVRDELLGFLLAGHDTSAGVLSWWVKYMARYQHVQHRLRAALHEAHAAACMEGRWPTMSEITSTPISYLDAVVEETTRWAAVATLTIRRATCDTQILGCAIPKGTDVMITLVGPVFQGPVVSVPESLRTPECIEAKDRIPAWDDDGAAYRPERWLKCERNGESGVETEVFDPHAGPNLAFSAGPRQCFGKKLAHMQLRMVMTLLTWNFKFDVLDEALNSEELVESMINVPQDCYVKLSKI